MTNSSHQLTCCQQPCCILLSTSLRQSSLSSPTCCLYSAGFRLRCWQRHFQLAALTPDSEARRTLIGHDAVPLWRPSVVGVRPAAFHSICIAGRRPHQVFQRLILPVHRRHTAAGRHERPQRRAGPNEARQLLWCSSVMVSEWFQYSIGFNTAFSCLASTELNNF